MADYDTLLVFEPDVLIRQPLCEFLRDCGYTVIEAGNAREAKVIMEGVTAVDVLLADARTEGAFDLASWARSNRSDIEIYLVPSTERAAAVAGELCGESPSSSGLHHHQMLLDRIKSLVGRRKRKAA